VASSAFDRLETLAEEQQEQSTDGCNGGNTTPGWDRLAVVTFASLDVAPNLNSLSLPVVRILRSYVRVGKEVKQDVRTVQVGLAIQVLAELIAHALDRLPIDIGALFFSKNVAYSLT
jgi:hypothetical protein